MIPILASLRTGIDRFGSGPIELGAQQLQRLLAELGVGQLVEHRVDRGLRPAAEQQLRHHAARGDRSGADLLAQRRLGAGPVLREELAGALGQRLVVTAQQRDQPGRDAAGPHVGERLERDPPDDRIAVGEPLGQRGLDGLVARADGGQHGDRRGPQLDALGLQQVDDRSAQVLRHECSLEEPYRRGSAVVKPGRSHTKSLR